MNPVAFYPMKKKVSPFIMDADVQLAIDRIALAGGTQLSTAKLQAYSELITDIKTADINLWNNKIKSFRMEAFNDVTGSDISLINIKNPNGNKAIPYGDAVYTTKGWKTSGVNGYLDSGFNINEMAIDSMTISRGFENDYPQSATAYEGMTSNSPVNRNVFIYPHYSTSDAFSFNDNKVSFLPGSLPTEKRFRTVTRVGDTRVLFRNFETPVSETVPAITPIIDGNYYQNALNRRNTSTVNYCIGTSWVFIGGLAITHEQHLMLLQKINIFLTKIGLPTINS